MLQLALGARSAGQSLVCEKSPLAVSPVVLRSAVPELVKVTICASLAGPVGFTTCAGNTRLVGENAICGNLGTGQLRGIVCVMIRARAKLPMPRLTSTLWRRDSFAGFCPRRAGSDQPTALFSLALQFLSFPQIIT